VRRRDKDRLFIATHAEAIGDLVAPHREGWGETGGYGGGRPSLDDGTDPAG
jgi:hypothetical protein